MSNGIPWKRIGKGACVIGGIAFLGLALYYFFPKVDFLVAYQDTLEIATEKIGVSLETDDPNVFKGTICGLFTMGLFYLGIRVL